MGPFPEVETRAERAAMSRARRVGRNARPGTTPLTQVGVCIRAPAGGDERIGVAETSFGFIGATRVSGLAIQHVATQDLAPPLQWCRY